jgi:uridine kinase
LVPDTNLVTGPPAPRILVDGRSGSGKTEFARTLVGLLPGAQLVRLDDIYPGWDGLEAASIAVHREILPRLRWQRFDWETNSMAEWHDLDPERAIVIEGCGSLSAGSRRLATSAIWIDLDPATRKARALARDGDTYAPHWNRWAAQEDAFIARENPRALADTVYCGAEVVAEVPGWLSRHVPSLR